MMSSQSELGLNETIQGETTLQSQQEEPTPQSNEGPSTPNVIVAEADSTTLTTTKTQTPTPYLYSVESDFFNHRPTERSASLDGVTDLGNAFRSPLYGHGNADLHNYPDAASFRSMLMKDIGQETRRQLALHLDPEHIVSPNWKSVAGEVGFTHLEIINMTGTQSLLNELNAKCPIVTVGDFCKILFDLRRHDVIQELERFFVSDYQRSNGANRRRFFSNPSDGSPAPTGQRTEYYRNQVGPMLGSTRLVDPPSSPPKYHAFVFYDLADVGFLINELIPRVEERNGMRLCIPDRDFQPGPLYYEAQLETMIKSCSKILVVLSDELIQSQSHQWGLNIAVAMDPACRQRKIIPVIYKPLSKISILSGLCACDRTQTPVDDWFWDKLLGSLRNGGQ